MLSTLYNKQRHANWQKKAYISFLLPIFILIALFVSVFATTSPVSAATSSTLNFQGRLLNIDGGLVTDGSYNIQFKIYDSASAGQSASGVCSLNSSTDDCWWIETRTIAVKNGYFSVYLADVSNGGTAFTTGLPWDQELWLSMNVNGDGEMSPRFKLTAVPYAFRAGALVDGSGAEKTADDFVQLAPSSIQTINAALGAIRLNQTGSGGLLQLQGDGSDVFTVDKTGAATLGAGITVGNSTSTTAGTIRWTGSDLEVYDGSGWLSLTSGGGGGGGTLTFDGFYAYDSAGNIDVSAGWTDITLDTEVKEDTPYTHAVDAASVTINDDGWYEVTYNISAYTSSGGNSDASIAAKLQENTGGGFTDIPGSFGYSAVTTGPSEGNVSVTITRQFTAGDIIKLQAQRATGGDAITILTRANSAGLTIRKFVTPSGGGGSTTAFEQGGNDFGATAILGTTTGSGDGLTIITDGNAALAFTSGGLATFSQDVTFNGDITSSTGLTISSGGGGDLILDSASDILKLNDATIQRSASGTTTIDLFDSGGGTFLSITNSDASQTAGLVVEGAVTAASISGNGSGLTDLDGSAIATGTIADARLTSNVSLLDTVKTFSARQTFSSGIVLGNNALATTGALRWTGTDFEGYDGLSWVSLTSGSGGGGGSSTLEGVMAYGKVQGSSGTALNIDGATVVRNSTGNYTITLDTAAPNANYTVQLSFAESTASVDGTDISIDNQLTTSFDVNIRQGTVAVDRDWYFTALDPNATSGGSSGISFEQGGNSFGATAILGTTDNNGLTIVTNSSTALTFTSGGAADFAASVDISGNLTLDAKLTRGTLLTPDSAAQAAFSTGASVNKGLIIQGATSQTANLFEIQDSNGAVLAGFNASGGLVLGLSTLTSNATSNQSINLPDASGTICLSGSDCGFLRLASATFATDSTTNNSIAINKTGASGNILALQNNGGAVFTVSNTGALQIQNSSSSALDIRNTAGLTYFSVDTTNGNVRVGSSVADATGVLFVLDTKNTAGDPVGQNGGMYYNSSTGKFRCYENNAWKNCINSGLSLRSFVDSVSDPVVDANTTNYWDIGAENNNSHPNITLSSASGVNVYGTVTFTVTSGTLGNNAELEVTGRIERGVGSVPTCGSGTVIGTYVGTSTDNSGVIQTSTATFIDTPNTTSPVFYAVCSDVATDGTTGNVTRIRVTLQEATNSN